MHPADPLAETETVLLFEPEGGRLAAVLSHACPVVLACSAQAQARTLYERYGPPMVVLAGGLADIHGLAQRMRDLNTSVGIVALSRFDSAEARVRTLASGVDACLPVEVEDSELLAVLHALARRGFASAPPQAPAAVCSNDGMRGVAGSGQQGGWTLCAQGWELRSSEGVKIGLSKQERALMMMLWESPARQVARADLVSTLASVDGVSGRRAWSNRSRAVDILVSRLRGKGKRLGVDVPLRSVYGYGYVFAD